jgi:hypothetical protein
MCSALCTVGQIGPHQYLQRVVNFARSLHDLYIPCPEPCAQLAPWEGGASGEARAAAPAPPAMAMLGNPKESQPRDPTTCTGMLPYGTAVGIKPAWQPAPLAVVVRSIAAKAEPGVRGCSRRCAIQPACSVRQAAANPTSKKNYRLHFDKLSTTIACGSTLWNHASYTCNTLTCRQ